MTEIPVEDNPAPPLDHRRHVIFFLFLDTHLIFLVINCFDDDDEVFMYFYNVQQCI